MRSLFQLAVFISLILFGASGPAFADDVDHFRQFTVPPDEARILALTGVREFRCDYEIMPIPSLRKNIKGSEFNYQQDLLLFAEEYEGTTCVGRYRLEYSVNALNDLSVPLKGILSFGWNNEKHELVSVIDNEQFYSPWSASLVLKDFSYFDQFFFENSTPEIRKGQPGSPDPAIYPVVGVCGDRTHKMNEMGFTDVSSFLKSCQYAGAKNAVVIYLYKSSFGEEPALKFDDPSSVVPSFVSRSLSTRLGLYGAGAVILFLIYWLMIRPKGAARK